MGYFANHIVEALKINWNRSFKYARLTYGLSLPVSFFLMSTEVAILPVAFFFDWRGKKWNAMGLPVMEKDFISMAETPSFKAHFLNPSTKEKFLVYPVETWNKQLRKLVSRKQYKQGYEEAQKYIKLLRDSERGSHFLLKHLLESIQRSIVLTVIMHKKVPLSYQEKFLKYRKNFILFQIFGLSCFQFVDRLAFSLQKKGVPIVIQDVPSIPIPKMPD